MPTPRMVCRASAAQIAQANPVKRLPRLLIARPAMRSTGIAKRLAYLVSNA